MPLRNLADTLPRDVRFALRQLRKSPSFTVTAVLTLAVAVAANSVAFSAVNGFVLRPLGLAQEESLYALQRSSDGEATESYPNYVDLRDRNRSFHALAAVNFDYAWLDSGGNAVHSPLFEVSGNYWDVVGVRPLLGRFFTAADERGANSAPYLVLSYAYWHGRLHDDRTVIGRTVFVSRHPFTIIGVAPPGFHGTVLVASPDFFVPIVNQQQVDGTSLIDARSTRWLQVIGHLKPGVTAAQAKADLDAIGASLATAFPKDDEKLGFALTRSRLSGGATFDTAMRAFLIGIMALAALILLAACANLGSLFAARAVDRSREIALRLALGASYARVVRQLFTEAMLIALVGGAIGMYAGVMVLGWLSTWNPLPRFSLVLPVQPDATVGVVVLVLTVASAFLFGAVPVRQVLRTDPHELIKSGSRTTIERKFTIRDLLLAVQIAVCAVLVTSSFVAVRGLVRSLHSDFGFDPRNVLLVDTDLSQGYTADRVPAMQQQMLDAMKAIPGVTAVALVGDWPPLQLGWTDSNLFSDDATDLRPSKAAADATTYSVSSDYFAAARTELVAGRAFTIHDDRNAPAVAVVNGNLARKLFGSTQGAIGRRFRLPNGTRVTVVGVAENGKYTANLAESAPLAVFFPILQVPKSATSLLVRSSRDVAQLSAAARAALHRIDQGLPAFIATWDHEMAPALFAPRVAAASLGILGAIGVIVAITGIFGMAAYSLTRQLKDLGIRMALGAQSGDVLRAALGRAFRLLAWGSAAGLVLGILASNVLGAIVYEATPRDPVVLVGVVLAMLAVGIAATWVPARRALTLDPLTLLREE